MPTEAYTTAVVHDYLTQRGGAERVVLDLLAALPSAPLFTSLFDPENTFPEFSSRSVNTLLINRIGLFRRYHRLALPFLASSFSRLNIDAAVTVCSSSGWAHGAHTAGRKIVYCHTPARWLYQTQAYLGRRRSWDAIGLEPILKGLRRWDKGAAKSAHRYLVNSTIVRDRVRAVYGIDADIIPPAPGLDNEGVQESIETLEPGFLLLVSRLLEYKNVRQAIAAVASMGGERLVIAGSGPLLGELRALAPNNISLLGRVNDEQLRWLYASCRGLLAPSYEDFGLSPLEAMTFGKPVIALRWGGYLDTVVEGECGVMFDQPDVPSIAHAITEFRVTQFSSATLVARAQHFSRDRFIHRVRAVVDEEMKL